MQQSFSRIESYEYRRNNTRISIAPDGKRAAVTAELHEVVGVGGRRLTAVSTEEATFEIEDGKLVITAVRTVTLPR